MTERRIVSLFAGIGGLEKGLEDAGVGRVVLQCEIDDFARQILARRYPDAMRHDDVRTLTVAPGDADVICGGFPCQPWSNAGKKRGRDDERHLWPEFARLVREARPAWVVGENVAALLSGRERGVCACRDDDAEIDSAACEDCGGSGVCEARPPGASEPFADLTAAGYDVAWDCVPAAAVGAPHRRDRVFILAWRRDELTPSLAASERAFSVAVAAMLESCGPWPAGDWPTPNARDWKGAPGAGTIARGGRQASLPASVRWPALPGQAQHPWEPPRTASGVAHRAARLRALGNAVVPAVAESVGHAMRFLETATGIGDARNAVARFHRGAFVDRQAGLFFAGDPIARWPRAGTIRDGTVYELRPAAPLTRAARDALWSTPAASQPNESESLVAAGSRPLGRPLGVQVRWPTPVATDAASAARHTTTTGVSHTGTSLTDAVRQWPTPRAAHDSGRHRGEPDTLHSAVKQWPTPATRDYKDTGDLTAVNSRDGRPPDTLPRVVADVIGHPPDPLNPSWVETLMGFPVGWTDPDADVSQIS